MQPVDLKKKAHSMLLATPFSNVDCLFAAYF